MKKYFLNLFMMVLTATALLGCHKMTFTNEGILPNPSQNSNKYDMTDDNGKSLYNVPTHCATSLFEIEVKETPLNGPKPVVAITCSTSNKDKN
jgi:hypothetical protein